VLKVHWQGGMAFEVEPSSGFRFVMDGSLEHGGRELGPSPVEALLSAAAACSGMDVVSILEKKRQVLTRYQIEVEWEIDAKGDWPHPIRRIVLRHILEGKDLDPLAVTRAVELSDEKYCTVVATLREPPEISFEFRIES
jgi:putative redox protein